MKKAIDSLANRILDLENKCNESRFANKADVDTFKIIEEQQNENTKKATVSHLRLFPNCLRSNDELRNPENILPLELDMLLAKFFLSV